MNLRTRLILFASFLLAASILILSTVAYQRITPASRMASFIMQGASGSTR